MLESNDHQRQADRELEALIHPVGRNCVAEGLGITEEDLGTLLRGEQPMDEDIRDSLSRIQQALGNAMGQTGALDRYGPPMEDVIALDLDGDGGPDVELPGGGVLSPLAIWSEDQERKRISLRSTRALPFITQFRLGMSYQEHVAALGMVTQVELALIAYFGESVPAFARWFRRMQLGYRRSSASRAFAFTQ